MKLAEVINLLILIATIIAIVYGPIKAVEIARRKDEIRDAEKRKRDILAALMRTRRAYMVPDHVFALNLIQLEFAEHPPVITAYRSYIANLMEPVPPTGNDLDNFVTRRSDLFFDLLHHMTAVVGLNFSHRDLERLAYVPIAWQNDDDEIRVFRRAMIEVLHGRRPLPVAPFQAQGTHNPFPPAPGAEAA